MSDKLSKPLQVDSYLFWWRFKQILFMSLMITILAGFLSITMFYRFEKVDNSLKRSVSERQNLLLK